MGDWIRVEDRVPDNEKLVVVRYKRTDTGQHLGYALTHYVKHWASQAPDFEFNRSTQPVKVTHWTALPDAPAR